MEQVPVREAPAIVSLPPVRRARRRFAALALLGLTAFAAAPVRAGENLDAWLGQVAAAARDNNYAGTIVHQQGTRTQSSRLVHFFEGGRELEKITSLDGPPREIIRSGGEVRSYYPDAKVVRVEPIAFRNSFPSLSATEQKALAEFYELKRAESGRVAGLDAQAWVLEPKDGFRFGHKFWVDNASGLLLKAGVFDDRGEVIEQFSFTDLAIGIKFDRQLVRPSLSPLSREWKVQRAPPNDIEAQDTGWVVARTPPGFAKVAEGYRVMRERQDPVVHLVYSDGLTAISVFIEKPAGVPRSLGPSRQGGINVYVRPVEDRMVTVLGEVPSATVRQMANSVVRR